MFGMMVDIGHSGEAHILIISYKTIYFVFSFVFDMIVNVGLKF